MGGILQKCLKKFKSFLVFVSAVLYINDIIFDIAQCKTYYDFAYGESTEDITVSKWYFVISILTWAGPPLCLILFWFISYAIDSDYGYSSYKDTDLKKGLVIQNIFKRPSWDKRDLELEPDDDEETIKEKTLAKNRSFCWHISMVVLEFILFYLPMATFAVYVYLPLMVLKPLYYSILNPEEKERDEDKKENSFFQLFEHVGEAIPQFSLAVIFYFNNYDYVLETDFSFEVLGFLVTQTLISLILSAISILKGIVIGIKICCTVKAWKTPQEEIHA